MTPTTNGENKNVVSNTSNHLWSGSILDRIQLGKAQERVNTPKKPPKGRPADLSRDRTGTACRVPDDLNHCSQTDRQPDFFGVKIKFGTLGFG